MTRSFTSRHLNSKQHWFRDDKLDLKSEWILHCCRLVHPKGHQVFQPHRNIHCINGDTSYSYFCLYLYSVLCARSHALYIHLLCTFVSIKIGWGFSPLSVRLRTCNHRADYTNKLTLFTTMLTPFTLSFFSQFIVFGCVVRNVIKTEWRS